MSSSQSDTGACCATSCCSGGGGGGGETKTPTPTQKSDTAACCATSCCGGGGGGGETKTPTPTPATAPDNNSLNPDEIREAVREAYGSRVSGKPIAKQQQAGEGGCCTAKVPQLVPSEHTNRAAETMGYTMEDLTNAPDGSNLGLGCGAPLQKAGVQPGMTVLDLGSGAGFDAFLAAHVVGPTGRVIGVDMTPEMVEKAREHAAQRAARANPNDEPQPQIDFYEGLIEDLPLENDLVDVVISNCVINLSPDKNAVFQQAFRVLKPGGHVCVSDIVLTQPLPDAIRTSLTAYMGCIAGASLLEDYVGAITQAGFVNVQVSTKRAFDVLACDDPIVKSVMNGVDAGTDLEKLKATIVSATVIAYKPHAKTD